MIIRDNTADIQAMQLSSSSVSKSWWSPHPRRRRAAGAAATLRLRQRSGRDHGFNSTTATPADRSLSAEQKNPTDAPYVHAKIKAADSNPSHSTGLVNDQGSDAQSSDQHREPPASQSPVPTAAEQGDTSVWGITESNQTGLLDEVVATFFTDFTVDESQATPVPQPSSPPVTAVVAEPTASTSTSSSDTAEGSAAHDINNSAAHQVHQQSSTAGILVGTSSRGGGGSSSSVGDNKLATSRPQDYSASSAIPSSTLSASVTTATTTEFGESFRSSVTSATVADTASEIAAGTATTEAAAATVTAATSGSTTGHTQSVKSSALALGSGAQDSQDINIMTRNDTHTGSASDSSSFAAALTQSSSVLTASTTTTTTHSHSATLHEKSSETAHSTSASNHQQTLSSPLTAIYATATTGSSSYLYPSTAVLSHGHGGSNFTAGGNRPSGTSTALLSDPTGANDASSSSQAQQAQVRRNTIVGSVVGSVSGVVMLVAIVLFLLRYKRRKHQMRITSEDFSDHDFNDDVLPPMKDSTLGVTRFLPSLFSNTNRNSSNYTNSSGILGSSESRSDFNSTSNLKNFLFPGYTKPRDSERGLSSAAATDPLNSEEYTRSFFRQPRPKKNMQINTDDLKSDANQYGALNSQSPTEEEYHLRPRSSELQQEQDFSFSNNGSNYYSMGDTMNSSTDQSNAFVTARASPLSHSYDPRIPSPKLPPRRAPKNYAGYNVHYAQPAPSSTGRFTETGSL